jgi:hypothetical protein
LAVGSNPTGGINQILENLSHHPQLQADFSLPRLPRIIHRIAYSRTDIWDNARNMSSGKDSFRISGKKDCRFCVLYKKSFSPSFRHFRRLDEFACRSSRQTKIVMLMPYDVAAEREDVNPTVYHAEFFASEILNFAVAEHVLLQTLLAVRVNFPRFFRNRHCLFTIIALSSIIVNDNNIFQESLSIFIG